MSCSLDSVKARLKRARAELLEMARHFSDTDIV
jgi:DNA-directed RNA polymerase specialized sigma24 family protein